jgi:hypothetical protein
MPVVYNLGQHGAPSSSASASLFSTSHSSSFSSSTWFGLSAPWLCGAVLVVVLLLFRYRRGKSRGVSMSQAETAKSTKSLPQSQWSPDDRPRPEKEAFSTSSPWSPTVATVIKHGHQASGTTATITTTPVRSVFPYPNPPSPTLSPMEEENEDQDREIPTLEMEQLQNKDVSPTSRSTSTTTATAPSKLPTPPRRRSYTKTSTVPISPPRAYTFPITADESEFQFGSGADPNSPLVMGIELAEEVIIAAEGWRRHTRVYGGGVCRACEESEEQMRLMGVRPVELDA